MDEKIKSNIINSGIPIDVYLKGYADLGPSNRSALERLANIATTISQYNLPIPPSSFIEMVADRTSGVSKQDFRMTVTGEPGSGKSYVTTYNAGRYAIEMAYRHGQNPKDFFSLENCALLQDTDGVTKLLDELDKYQAVVIDDAGVAAGSRDFATTSNKNLTAIYQTCRTRRWFSQFSLPVISQVDKQIRELVSAKSIVYKSFHEAGFNIVKINSTKISSWGSKTKEYNPRFTFHDRKYDFYVAYSTDVLDPFKGLIAEYDIARDKAAEDLIHERAEMESAAKDPRTHSERTYQQEKNEYYNLVIDHIKEGNSKKSACSLTTLTEYKINRMIGDAIREGKLDRKDAMRCSKKSKRGDD